MIEIEKKFILQSDDRVRLIAGATFLVKKIFTDVYYDTADHVLTKKDIWLRTREGKFELKFPVGIADRKRDITSYDEIEDDALIARKLDFEIVGSLGETLLSRGYYPFAAIATTRLKYEKDEFHIDIDDADFGYAVSKVELMVASEHDRLLASQRILDFVAAQGIAVENGPVIRGKVVEYIKRNNPDHFQALEKAWGIEL